MDIIINDKKYLETLENQAPNNSKIAYVLSKYYEKIDKNKYYNYLKQSAEDNINDSKLRLAECYEYGIGTSINYELCYNLYKELDDNSNLDGSIGLAKCYLFGYFIKKNEKIGFTMLKELDKTNENICIKELLIECYRYGIGTKKNLNEVLSLNLYLYDKGINNCTEIGFCYLLLFKNGNNIKFNEIKKWFLCAVCHIENKIIEGDNMITGIEHNNLGEIYYYSNKMTKKINKKYYVNSFYYFKKSSNYGNYDGKNGLGLCYYTGNGVKQNYQHAFTHFNDSYMIEPSEDNLYNLGNCYYNGHGVKKDYYKAFLLYDKAYNKNFKYDTYTISFQDNTQAIINYSLCYTEGYGVIKDVVKGYNIILKLNKYDYNVKQILQEYKKKNYDKIIYI